MTIHFTEKCPGCGAINHWSDDDFPDSSKADVAEVTCHSCKKLIVLVDGEYGTDYRPHMEGESIFDENDHGAHRRGEPQPTA